MSDPSNFHVPSCIDGGTTKFTFENVADAASHEYAVVDYDVLLTIHGITACNFTLKCESEDCSKITQTLATAGNFPNSPAEVDELMYDTYLYFHDQAADLPPFSPDNAIYRVTYQLVQGEEDTNGLLRSRVAVYLAAHHGYQDGREYRYPKSKADLLRSVKKITRIALENISGR